MLLVMEAQLETLRQQRRARRRAAWHNKKSALIMRRDEPGSRDVLGSSQSSESIASSDDNGNGTFLRKATPTEVMHVFRDTDGISLSHSSFSGTSEKHRIHTHLSENMHGTEKEYKSATATPSTSTEFSRCSWISEQLEWHSLDFSGSEAGDDWSGHNVHANFPVLGSKIDLDGQSQHKASCFASSMTDEITASTRQTRTQCLPSATEGRIADLLTLRLLSL